MAKDKMTTSSPDMIKLSDASSKKALAANYAN
jgi:hypothetical protein